MLHAAIRWIRNHSIPGQGVVLSSRQRTACAEVSGYSVPTLRAIDDEALATQYARWLLTVQNPDGSFGGGPGEAPYAFDTGQVIRGWVATLDLLPEVEPPLRRACDWLVASADSRGRLPVPRPGLAWSLGDRGEISEAIHLHCLAPLRQAGALLGEPRYTAFADRSLEFYLRAVPLTDFSQRNALTHFFALVQEALVELDCPDVARRGMDAVAHLQQDNGGVPAYADVHWVCAPGIAQAAALWYRLGERARADRALAFLAELQNPSGGFYGSYGPGADYFPAEEISWAAKYAIDACERRTAAHLQAAEPLAPSRPAPALAAAGPAHATRAPIVVTQPFPASGDMEREAGVNFFRTRFYDDANRELIAACKRRDEAYLTRHIAAQDGAHPEKFDDERFERRVGMQAIQRLLAPCPPQRILDVACGNAELLRQLARDGHRVAGIDVSPVRVETSRRDLGELQVSVAERIPFANAAFDVVVAQECLEHVMDLDRALREIHRVLKDDGLFLCQVPKGDFADGANHVRLFTEATLRWACEAIGFAVSSLTVIPYLVGEPPNNLFLVGHKRAAAASTRAIAASTSRSL